MRPSKRTTCTCSALKSVDREVWISAEGAHLSRLHCLPGLLDCSGLLGGCWLDLQALPRQVGPAGRLAPSPQAASSLVRAAQGCLLAEHMLSVTAMRTPQHKESLQQQLDTRLVVFLRPTTPSWKVHQDPGYLGEKLDAGSH